MREAREERREDKSEERDRIVWVCEVRDCGEEVGCGRTRREP